MKNGGISLAEIYHSSVDKKSHLEWKKVFPVFVYIKFYHHMPVKKIEWLFIFY